MESAIANALRLYAAKEYEASLLSLNTVDATDDNHLDLAYLLGLCHTRLGDWDEALLYLEQVVTASDNLMRVFQCRLSLAYVYSITERFRLAEYELGRLLKSGFRSVQVLSSLGYAAWLQGHEETALGFYSEALSLEPENPTALNGLGYILACAGKDLSRALTCCRKAVDKTPDNPAYLDSLGWVYYRLGRESEAREYIRRALEFAPESTEIREHAVVLDLPDPRKR